MQVCCPVLQILTRFQTKKSNYPHPFSDLAFRQKLCYHYRDQGANTKMIQIYLEFFLSYSFGIETIKMFIHSRSSLKNQPDSRPKWVNTCFQAKTALKPYPMGQHTPICLIQGSTPPPPGFFHSCMYMG